MSTHKTYPVKFVHSLILTAIMGWAVAVCITVGIMVHHHATTQQEERLKDNEQKRKDDTKQRIDALLHEKKMSQLRMLIHDKNKKLSITEVVHLAALEEKYAKVYGVPLEIGTAISMQESHWDTNAGTWCCEGIKQLNYEAHKEEYGFASREQLNDPEFNIRTGYEMLANHMRRLGSIERALKRYYGSSVQEENVRYANEVMAKKRYIEKRLS